MAEDKRISTMTRTAVDVGFKLCSPREPTAGIITRFKSLPPIPGGKKNMFWVLSISRNPYQQSDVRVPMAIVIFHKKVEIVGIGLGWISFISLSGRDANFCSRLVANHEGILYSALAHSAENIFCIHRFSPSILPPHTKNYINIPKEGYSFLGFVSSTT